MPSIKQTIVGRRLKNSLNGGGQIMVLTKYNGRFENAQGYLYVRPLGGYASGANIERSIPRALPPSPNANIDAFEGAQVIVKRDIEGNLMIEGHRIRQLKQIGYNLRQLNPMDRTVQFKLFEWLSNFQPFANGDAFNVVVQGGFYRASDGRMIRFSGATVNLASYQPATAGTQVIVCLWIDEDTNTVSVSSSSEFSQAINLNNDFTSLDTYLQQAVASAPSNRVGLWAYRIADTDTGITINNKLNDIRGLVSGYSASSSAGYPNPVTSRFNVPAGNTVLVKSNWKVNAGGVVRVNAGSAVVMI